MAVDSVIVLIAIFEDPITKLVPASVFTRALVIQDDLDFFFRKHSELPHRAFIVVKCIHYLFSLSQPILASFASCLIYVWKDRAPNLFAFDVPREAGDHGVGSRVKVMEGLRRDRREVLFVQYAILDFLIPLHRIYQPLRSDCISSSSSNSC